MTWVCLTFVFLLFFYFQNAPRAIVAPRVMSMSGGSAQVFITIKINIIVL